MVLLFIFLIVPTTYFFHREACLAERTWPKVTEAHGAARRATNDICRVMVAAADHS